MNYLYGGDGLFAIYVQNNGADTMYYVQKNYLGSYYCITNANGNIVTMNGQQQVYSFDPWGRRRNATTWTYNNVPKNFLFDRGFTGQEHLDAFGLINLNGRSYDPWLGRFLSVDPIVDDLSNTQKFNSYTYANNNPMIFIDPSGYDGIFSQDGGSGGTDPFGIYNPYWTYLTSIYGPTQSPFYYQGALFQFNQSTGQYGTRDFGGASASPGGGHYVGNGQYEDNAGNHISWNYVYENFVVPNASPLNSFQEGAIEEALRDGLDVYLVNYDKKSYLILSDGGISIGYFDGALVSLSPNTYAGIFGLAALEDPYTLLSQRIAESPNATLSDFIAYGSNSKIVKGNILEPNGPGSVVVGSHVRIPADIYTMVWTPTTNISSWMGSATYEIVSGPVAARGIRLHIGNNYKNTTGCLLSGCSSGYSDGNYYVNSSGTKLNEIEKLFGEHNFTLIIRNIP